MLNLFSGFKARPTPIEVKGPVEPASPQNFFNTSNFYEFLLQSEWGQVSAYQAIKFYDRIAPLATGIDMLSDEFATLEPILFDDSSKKFVKKDPVYNLLRRPNPNADRDLFFRQYAAYYEMTGNAYLMATGNPGRPPLEIFVIPSQCVTIMGNLKDGMPEQYTVSSFYGGVTVYNRRETNDTMRFIDDTNTRELYHIKDFNPNTNINNMYGQSRLSAIYMELEQHYHSSKHNLSLLKKGARLSGALVTDGILTEDQYGRLQKQIELFYQGSDNAGRIMLGEGGLKFNEMSINNKDMDFRKLKNDVTSAIYTRLKIPLALISPDHMTMSNMDSARLNLYDMAVLPLADRLYSELTKMLRPRYGWNIDLIFRYDQEAIPALQARRNEELKTKKQINVNTTNEFRHMMGYDPLDDGGDFVWQPNTMVPMTDDPLVTPAGPLPVEALKPGDPAGGPAKPTTAKPLGVKPLASSKPIKKEFFQIMRAQVDAKGNRLFSEHQIERIAEAEGLEDDA